MNYNPNESCGDRHEAPALAPIPPCPYRMGPQESYGDGDRHEAPALAPIPPCPYRMGIRINVRTAGISRRGEGGWDVDGWALVVAYSHQLKEDDKARCNLT